MTVWLILGSIQIGVVVGLFVAGLCSISHREDDHTYRLREPGE